MSAEITCKWSAQSARDAERAMFFYPMMYSAPAPPEPIPFSAPDPRIATSQHEGVLWDREMLRRHHARSCAPEACNCGMCISDHDEPRGIL